MNKTGLYITGSGSGIGKELALCALEVGHEVHGYSKSNAIEHPLFRFHQKDLSEKFDDNFEFEEIAADRLVLVNNAGALGEIAHAGHWSSDSIQKTMQLNLVSPMVLTNQFIRQFSTSSRDLRIINIGTGAASSAYDGWGLYCSSKAGLAMFSQVLYEENQVKNSKNIRVYDIAPGVVNSKMQEEIRAADSAHFSMKPKFIDLYAHGQLYDAKQVAERLLETLDHNYTEEIAFHRIRL